ncbi:ATP-dependent DNA helicase [Clostridiaceae bacterium M8S5]|nr:ATP-dependent DNA helicase [Clostridiaceae bacterium M8S5]
MCQINTNIKYAMTVLKELVKLQKKEQGIFISRDCVVTETFTGKTYKYKAYNYITGDNKYIGHKKQAVSEDRYIDLLTKLAEYVFYNISYPEIGEELIEYIFRVVFMSFEYNIRTQQIELAKHMYKAMINNHISLSDIAVGLGKTHAYLVALIVYDMRCDLSYITTTDNNKVMIISTSNKTLQRAIVKDYIPEISDMLLQHGIIDKPIRAVIRKGQENYICDIRLENHINNIYPHKVGEKEYHLIKNLIQSNEVDLSNITGIRDHNKQKIRVIPSHCRNCLSDKLCRYRRFINNANSSEYIIQVTNHNYMIANVLKRKEGHRPLLPDYKVVVYDEAHKITEAYIDMNTVQLKRQEVYRLINKIRPANSKSNIAKYLIKFCDEATKLLDRIYYSLNKSIPKELLDDKDINKYIPNNTRELRQQLRELIEIIYRIVIRISDRQRALQIELERIGDKVKKISQVNSILWVEYSSNEDFMICAVEKDINFYLGKDIFNMNIPILATSGTLAVNGNFDYIKRELGLYNTRKILETSEISPFNYYENSILYQADDLPYPNQEDVNYIYTVAERIRELIQASYGHALVLFTSYEILYKTYKILQTENNDYPMFIATRGYNNAVDDYRKNKNGVLLACGSAWEGINFSGDILSHLIIVKLPFPVPDPIAENQKSQFSSYNEFQEKVLIPKMVTKLKQGYGRAIRTETDTAVISILDIRASEKYKEVVRKALPSTKITNNIEDIKTFIQEKKSPEYFY